MIGGVYELIIQGSYSKNHYNKDVNSMININSKLIEQRRLKEDFDQRMETISLGELARRKSELIFVELGRDHLFQWCI